MRLEFDWDSVDMSILLHAKLAKPLLGTARIVINSIHIKGDVWKIFPFPSFDCLCSTLPLLDIFNGQMLCSLNATCDICEPLGLRYQRNSMNVFKFLSIALV